MKRFFNNMLLAALGLTLLAACWKEPDFYKENAVEGRRQVTDLKAEPGDSEVGLTWSVPSGWNPTDFVVSYTDAQKGKIRLNIGSTETAYTVKGLTNDVSYIFNVQAVYGKVLSGAVSVSAKPFSLRYGVENLTAEAAHRKVTLSWTVPESDKRTGYEIKYAVEGAETQQTLAVDDPDAVSCTIDGLTDDEIYTFEIVAKYIYGDSDPRSIKKAAGVPYYMLESDKTAIGLPVAFAFNREGLPDATGVTWTFPEGTLVEGEGDEVKARFMSAGENAEVTLSVNVDGEDKEKKIYVNVREYVIFDNQFEGGSTGFKGGAPMFSPDGKTVYNITFNKKTNLIAWDLFSGTKKWTRSVGHASYNGLTVNPVTGDIYFGTQTAGDFFAYEPDGDLKWQFNEAGSMQSASPAVNADGSVVYIVDAAGKTFAIDAETGDKLWGPVALGAKGSGLLVNGDELVVAVNNTTKAISWLNAADGEIIAQCNLSKKIADICGAFGVSPDKNFAYCGQEGGAVSKINLAEHTVEVNSKVVGTNNMWGVVVSPDGDVFFGGKDSKCYLVDGTTMEHKKTFEDGLGSNAFNYSRACSDTEGRFYISSNVGWNYVLSHDLEILQKFQVPDDANKQMGGNNYLDGIFYASYGSDANPGHFVGKYVGGESYMAYGIDICGSCCIK